MTLYKENRINQKYEMSWTEIINQFLVSEFNKDVVWAGNSILYFIGSREGLNSSFDAPLGAKEQKLFEKALDNVRSQINYSN